LSCSFVSQVPPLPAFRGNGCFHDAKIICPDLLSVTPITVHATIFTVRPPRPVPACFCVPVIPASLFYSPLVRWPSPDFRLPDRRMYRFVSIYFDAKFEKKTELRNPCFDPA
jgi:hypothetical protein